MGSNDLYGTLRPKETTTASESDCSSGSSERYMFHTGTTTRSTSLVRTGASTSVDESIGSYSVKFVAKS